MIEYVLYTRPTCSLCDQAKTYLKDNKVPFAEFEIRNDDDRTRVRTMLPEEVLSKGGVVLPIVFDDKNDYVGGKDDLIKHHLEHKKDFADFDRDAIFGLLKNNIATIVFEKVNGDLRKMRCTLKESMLPKYTSEKSDKERKTSEHTLAVYDVDEEGWRSFRLNSIKSVKVG